MTKTVSDWSNELEKALLHQKKGEMTEAHAIIKNILPSLQQALRDNPNKLSFITI